MVLAKEAQQALCVGLRKLSTNLQKAFIYCISTGFNHYHKFGGLKNCPPYLTTSFIASSKISQKVYFHL